MKGTPGDSASVEAWRNKGRKEREKLSGRRANIQLTLVSASTYAAQRINLTAITYLIAFFRLFLPSGNGTIVLVPVPA